ncbi:hypothetical protein BAUCODRAFT_149040 [Baudoinia panamericana UAMH 10762]|uniref:Vta1 C-terminal domain-containing protein n=1 Tax=Baudoinia panamericana (strain UAMH 10762) TaxID=717646 RepID=M2MEM1_BAUPA|nr:uncharacterized protein BAUCODRAFT_149040 [Baudoinia panamericana UAMH 10762]EMC95006.1 hypothetical protein BAUCODRAFT_149040 [Baudoinia panamericana UAMH 10762]
MATPLPGKLKSAGIQPFATRAAQLEKYRPIVSYWCEYYALQQILSKQLHIGDNDSQNYAIHLMDKLEQTKAANTTNDAIIDDIAAKAYVENFALETFHRADEAQRGHHVTRQTADTFQAAATFIDLLTIWGPLDQEMAAKSKFAKYHALRIAKAIKAGEDPNASNPVVAEEAPPALPMDDGIDAELKAMESQSQQQNDGTRTESFYQKATVENAEDPSPPNPSAPHPDMDKLSHRPTYPIRAMSETSQSMSQASETNHDDVSPIEPSEGQQQQQRHSSLGGGYFPSTPADTFPAITEKDEEAGKEREGQGEEEKDTPMPDSDADAKKDDGEGEGGGGAPPKTPPIVAPQPTTYQRLDNPAEFYSANATTTTVTSPSARGAASELTPLPPPLNGGGGGGGGGGGSAGSFHPDVETTSLPGRSTPAPTPAPAPYRYRNAPPAPTSTAGPAASHQPPVRAGGEVASGRTPPTRGYNTDDESVLSAQKHAKWAISALNFEDVATAVRELRGALRDLGAG